jgi:Mg2+ and Co2+ transporter CorA
LEDKLENMEQAPGAKRDITKMKQDIRLLENKVDQVLEYLQKQQELLQAAAKTSGEEKQ